MAVPWWAWVAVVGVIAALLAVDLLVSRSRAVSGPRSALILTVAWIGSAVGFGIVLGAWRGSGVAAQYFAGYLLEKALSVDNMFVFAIILRSFSIPRELQHRVLSYGVVGALALRAAFIAGGGALLDAVSWTTYLFGAFLLVAGARMARGTHVDPERNLAVRALRATFPVTPALSGERFLVRENGRWIGTGLLMALVTIEASDLVFATDSIPAIFGVTRDVFVVFTSNAFAVLGLRALYLLLADALDRFVYLGKGLAVLLVVIGAKMLLSHVVDVPVAASLGLIVAVLGTSVAASLWRDRTAGDRGRATSDRQS